eukprot:6762461-Prorocentrum_lima.AAC.1
MTDPETARYVQEFRHSWAEWVAIVSEASLQGEEPHGTLLTPKRRTWLWQSSGTPQTISGTAAQERK